MPDQNSPALSFVIPLYNSAETLPPLVEIIESLHVEGGHELVLVNDGSSDRTAEVCRNLVSVARIPITFIDHSRNYGEHNAVLTGWRHARGAYVVNIDDDGQNPPDEAVRLFRHAQEHDLDVVYGCYDVKQHSAWRNAGSWMTNRVTDFALDKPAGLYLSSFRCVSAFVARQVVANSGPFPYIDGLLLQVTQRVGSLLVRHDERQSGASGYTIRRLGRLWLSTFINFSVFPLRIATVLGIIMAFLGFVALGVVIYSWFHDRGPQFGWGTLMAALLTFSGVQLIILGLCGEYIGRMFITINQRPQAVIREVVRNSNR
ncbi:MAG: glycosyltransferase family 2 protein [Opitutaceae bacterium]|nr:glycosyltransferase family 2 protein [Opitutaceae bacterium]